MTFDILLSKWEESLLLSGTNPHNLVGTMQKHREYFQMKNAVSRRSLKKGIWKTQHTLLKYCPYTEVHFSYHLTIVIQEMQANSGLALALVHTHQLIRGASWET